MKVLATESICVPKVGWQTTFQVYQEGELPSKMNLAEAGLNRQQSRPSAIK